MSDDTTYIYNAKWPTSTAHILVTPMRQDEVNIFTDPTLWCGYRTTQMKVPELSDGHAEHPVCVNCETVRDNYQAKDNSDDPENISAGDLRNIHLLMNRYGATKLCGIIALEAHKKSVKP